jgi:hypothetical protein
MRYFTVIDCDRVSDTEDILDVYRIPSESARGRYKSVSNTFEECQRML